MLCINTLQFGGEADSVVTSGFLPKVNHVSRWCRSVLTGLVAALLVHPVSVAQAQGLEIAPIGIDLGDDSESLVLAAFPAADNAPIFGSVQGGSAPAAAVVAVGFPQPSIIVGLIEPGQEEEFGLETLLPSTIAEYAFALDDLAAREALRESDPDIFRRLVEEGHVDPEDAQLKRVLQTELARMNCYRSRIDGDWGRGSRRSVGEYFAQLASVDWPDAAATNDLFRAILLNGDVACPTPVAAAPKPRATSTRTTTTRTSQPRAAAPKPAAKPAAKPKLSIGGSGVLR